MAKPITMPRFRFSLLALFLFVAVVAIASAALARPSQLWSIVMSSLVFALLVMAVPAAAFGRNAGRAFWLGFAVAGWGYFALDDEQRKSLPTELAERRLHDVILGPGKFSAKPTMSVEAIRAGNIAHVHFPLIAAWLKPLSIAFVGGLLAGLLYVGRGSETDHKGSA